MTIKAVLFDQDGVIIDTEKDGHRVAFNETFKAFNLDMEWDEVHYGKLLKIGGGKERMLHEIKANGLCQDLSSQELSDLIQKMHSKKTDLFISLLESGKLPLRPGVHRLMREITQSGIKIGVCTTSNERVANFITSRMLSDINFDLILAGDIVKKKKPDPEIYNLALKELDLSPPECIVIEDSNNGLEAAKAAGLRVVITTNAYTEKEDLNKADIIVTCLGDVDGVKGELIKGNLPGYSGLLTVAQLYSFSSKILTTVTK